MPARNVRANMARRMTNLTLPKVSAPKLPTLGKKKPAAAEITVQATKLSLSLAADAAPPKSVLLEVDMPGDADEPLRSKAAAVSKGSATLGFKHAFAAGAGSSLHAALAAALQSESEEDSEIQLYVYAVDAKGGEKELGVAAVSLEALLAKGADHALGAVAVKDAKGVEVAQLTVAVTALAALREIDAGGDGAAAAPAAAEGAPASDGADEKQAAATPAAEAAPAPAAAPGTPDRDECPICFEPEKSTALVPCGHILCGACAAKYAHCPVCREVVSSRMRVFW